MIPLILFLSLSLIPGLVGIESYDVGVEHLSVQEKIPQEPLFVGLGSNCFVALRLRELNLRCTAFPLDWCLSIDNAGLIRLLEDDFMQFGNNAYLKSDKDGYLLNTFYRLVFPYEGDFRITPSFELLEKFEKKYAKRIDRFREVDNVREKVFFIRSSWVWAAAANVNYTDEGNLTISDEWSFRLYDTLKKRFPDLDFHLLIMNTHGLPQFGKRCLSKDITMYFYNPHLTHCEIFTDFKNLYTDLLEKHGFSNNSIMEKVKSSHFDQGDCRKK